MAARGCPARAPSCRAGGRRGGLRLADSPRGAAPLAWSLMRGLPAVAWATSAAIVAHDLPPRDLLPREVVPRRFIPVTWGGRASGHAHHEPSCGVQRLSRHRRAPVRRRGRLGRAPVLLQQSRSRAVGSTSSTSIRARRRPHLPAVGPATTEHPREVGAQALAAATLLARGSRRPLSVRGAIVGPAARRRTIAPSGSRPGRIAAQRRPPIDSTVGRPPPGGSADPSPRALIRGQPTLCSQRTGAPSPA